MTWDLSSPRSGARSATSTCNQPKVTAAQYELVINRTGAQLRASNRTQSPPRDFARAISGRRIGIPGIKPPLMMIQKTIGTASPLAVQARNRRSTSGASSSNSRSQYSRTSHANIPTTGRDNNTASMGSHWTGPARSTSRPIGPGVAPQARPTRPGNHRDWSRANVSGLTECPVGLQPRAVLVLAIVLAIDARDQERASTMRSLDTGGCLPSERWFPAESGTFLFLVLVSLDRCSVAGFFDGGNQRVGGDFVFLNFDHRFVRHCDFCADHSGYFHDWGPHSA